MRHFLDALQNIETAAAAIPFHRIRRIGHHLKLVQNELRDHQDAVEETRIGNIGDTAIDDHAGIEDLLVRAGLRLRAEKAAQRGKVQQLAFGRARHRADVSEEQQAADLREVDDVRAYRRRRGPAPDSPGRRRSTPR